jgi:hypothetical protein
LTTYKAIELNFKMEVEILILFDLLAAKRWFTHKLSELLLDLLQVVFFFDDLPLHLGLNRFRDNIFLLSFEKLFGVFQGFNHVGLHSEAL